MLLPTGFGMLGRRLGGPRPRLDVTPLLQGEHKPPVSDDYFALVEALQDPLQHQLKSVSWLASAYKI